MRGVKNQQNIQDNRSKRTSRAFMNGSLGRNPTERRLDGR